MDAGTRRLQVPDESMAGIRLGVQFETEAGRAPLLPPIAVPTPPRLRLLATGLPMFPRVGGDERRVLDHASTDPEALHVQLSLQLSPHQPIPACLG